MRCIFSWLNLKALIFVGLRAHIGINFRSNYTMRARGPMREQEHLPSSHGCSREPLIYLGENLAAVIVTAGNYNDRMRRAQLQFFESPCYFAPGRVRAFGQFPFYCLENAFYCTFILALPLVTHTLGPFSFHRLCCTRRRSFSDRRKHPSPPD